MDADAAREAAPAIVDAAMPQAGYGLALTARAIVFGEQDFGADSDRQPAQP